jgi:APA family basic amino acid/polyamine antiporter
MKIKMLNFQTFPLWLNLTLFFLAGVMVWVSGTRLTTYADIISDRKHWDKASSNTPVAEILRGHGSFSVQMLGIVSILIINGALAQIIMASRVIYGLSKKDQAPIILGKINSKTQTPLLATALITFIVLVLAIFFPLQTLAEATSFIILFIFAIVNLSLWFIKGREKRDIKQKISFPRWVSLFGFIVSIGVLIFQVGQKFFLNF